MPHTVVIVDDTDCCGDTLALALGSLPDVEVHTVASAKEALRFMDTMRIDALITDLHMPRIDGFELIERVRAEPRFNDLRILVISGDTDAGTPDRLRRLGADAFFPKPFSPTAVRQRLEQLLHAD